MKAFVKLQCDIVDRFETSRELLLYVCLLCLMDREGRIRMNSNTLAERIRWKLDAVQDTMEKLMRPNPASKCKKHDGACVVFLDPDRPHLGFLIPAAVTHRKRHADTQRRQDYRAKWMREKRAELRNKGLSSRRRQLRGHCEDTREQRVNTREPPLPSKTQVSEHCVNTREQNVNREREGDRDIYEKSLVDISLAAHKPSRNSSDPDLIHSVDQVIELICEKVYDNLVRKNQVGQDTLRLVVEMLPFSRKQIDLVADYMTMPADECFPELKKRRPLAFNQLIRWWADQVSLAVQFDQKYFAR